MTELLGRARGEVDGRRHVGYGAQAKHYDTVGAALLDTLARGVRRPGRLRRCERRVGATGRAWHRYGYRTLAHISSDLGRGERRRVGRGV